MNKLKFFGCALMAVLFAFSMASCEEENFNTTVDPEVNIPPITIPGVDIETELPDYNPGDAVISIQPTVWAFIDGKVDNVTALATIKFNGVEKKTYNASSATGFEAMTIKITASYDATVGTESKTLTAEMSLEIPALGAGKLAIFTPTLIMSAKSPSTDDEGGEGEGEGGGTIIVPGADGVDYAYILGEGSTATPNPTTTAYMKIENTSSYYYIYSTALFEDALKKDVKWETLNSNHKAGVDAVGAAYYDLLHKVFQYQQVSMFILTPLLSLI